MRLQHLRIVICLLVVVITPDRMSGQKITSSTTCEAITRTAVAQIGSNCAGLERNHSCYGYPPVTATSVDEAPNLTFSQPGQQIPLTNIKLIQTSSLDLTENV